MLANYHTHTPRCLHAVGTEADYAESALKGGFEVLGFSDHCPWDYHSRYVADMRMRPDQLPGYCAAVNALQKRYADKLRIYLGLECEYFPEYLPWQQENVQKYGMDYLILGNHYDLTDETGIYFGLATRPEQLLHYTDTTIAGMRTGLFAYLAHPDLALNAYPRWDDACQELCERLCEAALQCGMPLEYNILGHDRRAGLDGSALGYTTPRFWQIAARMGCTAIIGQDAHDPRTLADPNRFAAARAFLDGLGITTLEILPGLGK